jgi:hypothetical protein
MVEKSQNLWKQGYGYKFNRHHGFENFVIRYPFTVFVSEIPSTSYDSLLHVNCLYVSHPVKNS